MKLSNEATFTMTTKTNPRREGTVQHKLYAQLLKAKKGTTVGEISETQWLRNALQYAVDGGHATVSGNSAPRAAAPAKAKVARKASKKAK